MKPNEFRDMTDAQLNTKLADLKAELFGLRFSHATRRLENPKQLVKCKKDIARVKTVMRERELAVAKK
ncbi:MAG: 50S ribosomal protein L29 [Firmicutes bacterium]|nr:50S ribosomal protein L29 [Bacillota bacterium]